MNHEKRRGSSQGVQSEATMMGVNTLWAVPATLLSKPYECQFAV